VQVTFLSASGELGGAETCLLDVIASLRRLQPGWPLRLIVAAEGPLAARAATLGVGTTVLPLPARLARVGEAGAGGRVQTGLRLAQAALPVAAYVPHLRQVIAAGGADVVHANNIKMHVLGAWASSRTTPIVWHLHDYVGSRPMTARLLRRNARRCAAVVANSESVAVDAREALSGRVPVTVVRNAVDLERFCEAGERLDLDRLASMPPAPPSTLRVGLLGTFARWKGHTTFLDALTRLPPDVHVRAYVIGGPVYQTEGSQYSLEELRAEARSRGLSDRVGFTGFVTTPEAALRALDIVVHASTAPEPFGLVIAQAMACGRAVIASEAGGALEVITPGVDALGHAPGDAAGLADRVAELARDPALRERLGRAGRATAERRFNRARLAEELLPVYESAVAKA